jgi:hypothetical protein
MTHHEQQPGDDGATRGTAITKETTMAETNTALAPMAETRSVAVAAPDTSMLNFIATALERPEIDAQKLQALLQAQFMVEDRDAQRQFNGALHAAQQAMPRVAKNGVIDLGGKGKIAFATWEDVDTALRPIMERFGFSLSFSVQWKEGGGGVVVGKLMHSAGHAQEYSLPLPSDQGAGRNNLQAMGSMLSYGKRYIAEMAFNIVRTGADDDGERGGRSYITEQQKGQLVDLLAETNADTAGFLRWCQIDSLDEMEAKNFPAALNALLAKAKGKGGKA